MTEVVTQRWLEQVMQEHRDLSELVGELQRFLDQPRPDIGEKGFHTWAANLSERLVRLHDKLFRHFRHEEEGGMQEELLQRHPRAERQIGEVMGEHPEMLAEIRALMLDALSYSEGTVPPEPALRQRLLRILDQLHKHEQAETELIQRLEYRDIGSLD
jgi:hypothetical protein